MGFNMLYYDYVETIFTKKQKFTRKASLRSLGVKIDTFEEAKKQSYLSKIERGEGKI
jgi:hypothetical protein